ncbi:hypothetical protein ABIB48_002652 [Arthrobacter sp. UYCu511]|uniref:hypothetical protein n=1 Tax=Arthrobacter sp. UYCu511 TaxID=3156337 RepID=UPI003393572F
MTPSEPLNPARRRIYDDPQPMELTAAPTRRDWHRWTVADALAVLKAEEARLHAQESDDGPADV